MPEKPYRLFTEKSCMFLVINDGRLSLEDSKRIRQKLQIPLNSICLDKIPSMEDSHPEIENRFENLTINKIAPVPGGIHPPEDLTALTLDKLLDHIRE